MNKPKELLKALVTADIYKRVANLALEEKRSKQSMTAILIEDALKARKGKDAR
jgi:hypothetical protein